DRNRSHWSTSKTPSYTKSVSWQHHQRTDTFLFVLIQKISSVGVQTGVVLYGCVTLLMTSFDVQQHHGAARHFTSVSAIAQEQIFPNWDMPANCW
ncbi:hypothetical protein, partial [Escherichia coli]|uniref:hypothetical protein n=1 Tax=Escherichia coli TaxID=562 RepID=UPI001BE3F416